jgi:AcrR family transcriptional regulator
VASKRGPGRPRDAERHEAILEATRQLIVELGYSRVSMDRVAKRAGVSRTTIHKWWSHRALLVEEAIFPDYSDLPVPDTGTLEGDLEVLVAEMVARITRPAMVRGLPALYAEVLSDPELLERTSVLYAQPAGERWRAVFTRAAQRGELAQSADPIAAMHVVLGSISFMAQTKPRPILPLREMTGYLVSLLRNGV